MSVIDEKYEETLANIVSHYENRVAVDPAGTFLLVNQELESQSVRYGNDWTGRGVVMDAVIAATIAALEIVRSSCLSNMENKTMLNGNG